MTIEEVWGAAKLAALNAPYGTPDDRAATEAAISVLRQHLIPRATVDDGELVERSAEVRSELWAALIGNDQSHKDLIDRIEALTAENERLRGWLEGRDRFIVDQGLWGAFVDQVIRAALGDTQ